MNIFTASLKRTFARLLIVSLVISMVNIQGVAMALAPGPSLISPSNLATINKGVDLNMDWSDTAGASFYEVWIDNNSGFGSPEVGFNNGQSLNWVNNGIVSASNFNLTVAMQNLLPQNLYYWKVRALDPQKNPYSDWSVVSQFSLMNNNTPPAPPTLIAPANGTVFQTMQNVDLTWNAVAGAGRYRFKVATDAAMSNIIYSQEVVGTTVSAATNFFAQGQTYYWQVGAINVGDTGGWGAYGPSPAWSFSFAAAPIQTITLNTPGPTVTTKNIDFNWSTLSGVSRYELYVDNNSGFGSPEISSTNIAALKSFTFNSYTVSDYWLEPGQTYYWKVLAIKSDNSSVFSNVGTFVYNPPRAGAPVWVPLFRLYNPTGKDHYYTTVPAQRDLAITTSGYKYEHEEGYVSDRPTTDSNVVPLFRLYNNSNNYNYYTTNPVDKDSQIVAGSWYQGIVGFVSKVNATGYTPLYYTENVANKDNFYTTSQFERDNSIAKFGFIDHGNIGYVKYLAPTNLEQSGVESKPQANFGGADLGSGAYRGLNSEDLSMDGRGPSLSFSHYYNSYNLNHYPMGKGWSHNLDSYLLESTESGLSKVYVFWGSGATSEFQKNGLVYNDLSGNHDQLTLINDGVNYGYDLKSKDQTVYQYRRLGNEINSEIVLIKIIDWRGDYLSLSYDAASFNLYEAQDGFGRKLVFSYNSNGQLIKVQENIAGVLKRSVSFTYDANGLLSSFTDARGKITTFSYFSDDIKKDLLQSITYPKNNTVTVDYDAARKVSSVKEGVSNPSSVQYSVDTSTGISTSTITDPQGVIYQSRHNSLMRFIGGREGQGASDAWQQIERTDTNNPNAITKIIDREGRITTFVYDLMGNLTQITNAKGKVANFTYNDKNNLVSRTDFFTPGSTSNTTTYTYDTNNYRLIKITNSLNEVVNLNYDEGLAPGKNILTSVTDNALNRISFIYDSYGNLIQIANPENKLTKALIDEWGRIKEYTDAENIKTTFDYDDVDNLINTKYFSRTLVQLFTVNNSYDNNGNLENVSWVNEGFTALTQYIYDNLDRLSSLKNPVDDTYSYTYTANDNIKTRVSPVGDITSYEYDTYGRLNKIVYPNTAANFEVLSRDKNGSILSLKSEQGTSYFIYDELMHLTKYTDTYGKIIQYTYDDAGRLKTLTYPDGKVVNYTYDSTGRLKTVSGLWFSTTTYVYDSAGRLSEVQRGNGTKAKYTYDKVGNLLSLQELKSGGTVLASYSYELDNVGNRKSVTVNTEPLAGMLTANSVNYTYDSKTNRLLSAGPNTYTYDKNGNRKSTVNGGVATTFNYDYENRLTGVVNQNISDYRYDAFGNRIYKKDNGTVTKYVMDISGLGNVLSETDANGVVKANYVYGLGLIERVDLNGAQQFYHFNGRGDTLALTDSNQNVTDSYAYDEFGKLLNSSGLTLNPFKFSGKFGVMDDGNGLNYMRARFYDPEVGRFISEDPLHFGGGDWNLYSYAGNNPVNAVDPSGKFIFLIPEAYYVGALLVSTSISAGMASHHLGAELGYWSEGNDKLAEKESDGVWHSLVGALDSASLMYETTSMSTMGTKNTTGINANNKNYPGRVYGYKLKENVDFEDFDIAKFGLSRDPYFRYSQNDSIGNELMSKNIRMEIMWPPMSFSKAREWENKSILNFIDVNGVRPRLNYNNH